MKTSSMLIAPLFLLVSACNDFGWEINDNFISKMSPDKFISCTKLGEKNGSLKIFAQDIDNPYGYTIVAGKNKNIEGDIHYKNGIIKLNFSSSVFRDDVKREAKKRMLEVHEYFLNCNK